MVFITKVCLSQGFFSSAKSNNRSPNQGRLHMSHGFNATFSCIASVIQAVTGQACTMLGSDLVVAGTGAPCRRD